MVTHNGAFHKMERDFIASHPIRRGSIDGAFIARSLRISLIGFIALYASLASLPVWAQSSSSALYGMPGFAQAPDVRWVESMIADGLSRFALELCENRLTLYSTESDAYAQWMMLAMQSQAALDLENFDFSGDPQGLDGIAPRLEKLSSSLRGKPRELWVRWKILWCRWLIQQRGLASYMAAPTREPLKRWVINSIRTSLDAVEQLEQDIRKLPAGPGKPITSDQKLDLQGRVALLQADILYQRSKCYPSGSDDSIAAAAEMLRSLDQALSKLPADWIHRPSLAIARISSQIQLQQYDEATVGANKLWDSLRSEKDTRATTIQYEEALAVVGARGSRLRNRKEEFDDWVRRGGGPLASPELALEQFAADLEWGGDQAAERALEWKRDVGRKFGSYWEQRLDALLVSSNVAAKRTVKAPSLEILRIEVRQLLAAKRWDEAIDKLQKAEFAAAQLQADDEAFAFGMQVAAAYENQGKREQAATTFFECASKYPTQGKAAAASLMGAWLIRPGANPSGSQTPEQSALYRDRLKETALKWPTTDAAKQAVDWFERDCLARDNILPVIELWNKRSRETQQSSSAIGRYLLGFCIRNDAWLEPSTQRSTEETNALQILREALVETYSEVDREPLRVWITATESDLRWGIPQLQGDSTTWLGSLARIVNLPRNLPREGSIDAEILEGMGSPWEDDPLARVAIYWYACEAQAAAMLLQPKTPSKQEYQGFRAQLRLLQQERDGESVYPLGPSIDDKLQRAIRFFELLAAGGEGEWKDTLKRLEGEREANPKSAWWLYRSARVLQSLEPHRREAIPLYRVLASGFPAGSEPWFEARARTAQSMRWINDSAAADQLRDLVFATYPGAEAKWRNRFDGK